MKHLKRRLSCETEKFLETHLCKLRVIRTSIVYGDVPAAGSRRASFAAARRILKPGAAAAVICWFDASFVLSELTQAVAGWQCPVYTSYCRDTMCIVILQELLL